MRSFRWHFYDNLEFFDHFLTGKTRKKRKFRTFSHVLLHKFWNFYLFWTSQSKVHFQGNIPRYETPVTNEFRTFWAEMSPLINLLFIIYKSIIKLSQIYHIKLYYKKYIKIFWALMTYDNLVFLYIASRLAYHVIFDRQPSPFFE